MRSLLKKITGICLLTVISVCMIIPSAGCSTKNAKNKYIKKKRKRKKRD